MNKVKNNIKDNFTIVPNGLIKDDQCHPMAKQLYIYMASKPDNWQFNNTDLLRAIQSKDQPTLRKYMGQLLTSGWVSRIKSSAGYGYDYTINEKPLMEKPLMEPLVEKPTMGKTHCGKNHYHSNKEYLTNKEKESNKEIDIKDKTRIDFQNELISLPEDSPENRMKDWAVLQDYMKTNDFKNTWDFLCAGIERKEPFGVIATWVALAEWHNVKNLKINKAKNWIKNDGTKRTAKGNQTFSKTPRINPEPMDISGRNKIALLDQYIKGLENQ